MVLQKTLESPWEFKEIKLVNLKGNQPCISFVKTDADADAQYFCHLMRTVNSLKKTLMVGKTKEKRRRGWQRMRWLDSINDLFEQTLRDCGGEKSMAFAIHEVAKSQK